MYGFGDGWEEGVTRDASDNEHGAELMRRDAEFLFSISVAKITKDINTVI